MWSSSMIHRVDGMARTTARAQDGASCRPAAQNQRSESTLERRCRSLSEERRCRARFCLSGSAACPARPEHTAGQQRQVLVTSLRSCLQLSGQDVSGRPSAASLAGRVVQPLRFDPLLRDPQPPGSRRGIGGAEAKSKVAPEKLFWLSLALLSCLTVHPGRPDQRGRHCWRFCQTWSPTTTAVHFRPGQKALTAQRRARAPLRSIR